MALKDVGVRLRVEGLSGFRSSMTSADSSMQGIGTRLRGISSEARTAGIALVGLGASITAVLGFSAKTAASFEQAITNAVSVTGYMGDEAEIAKQKMSDLARELGSTTKFTASEVANAMYDLASKGFKPAEMSVEELLPFLSLAAATQADLAMTTETVTSTLRAFGLETTESGRVADVFAKTIGSSAATIDKLSTSMAYVAPVAKAANMSLEETSAFLGALYNTGLDASMAGTALRGVLAELMSPSNDLTSALDEMGLTLDDVDLSTTSVTKILAKLRKAGMTNKQVMDVFGKRAGPAALSLMGVNEAGVATVDTIAELTDALQNAGETAENMAEMQLDTTEGKITILKSAIEELKIIIGDALIPIISSLATKIKDLLIPIGDWMQEHPTLTKIIVIGTAAIGALTTALGAAFLALSVLPAVISGVSLAVGGLGIAINIALGPIGLIILAIGALAAGAYLIVDNWDAIADFFTGLWDKIWSALEGLWDSIYAFMKDWGLIILGLIFPPALIAGIVIKWKDEIVTWLGDLPTKIWNAIKTVGAFIVRPFRDGYNYIKTAVGNILSWFTTLPAKIWNAIKNLGAFLIRPFRDAYQFIKQVVEYIKSAFNVIGNVGSSIWNTLGSINPFGATGGTVEKSGMVMVGEQGPELVSLPAGAYIHPNETTNNYNITENYARPESSQSVGLTLESLAMYARS